MICGERSDLFMCTLDAAHAGAHTAVVFGCVVDSWCDDPELVCGSCNGELVIPVTDITGLSFQVCYCAPPLGADEEAALVASVLARIESAA